MSLRTFGSLFITYIKNIFSVDTRSLAVLRIGLGIVIFIDLLVGLQFFSAFHSEISILPLDVLMNSYPQENVRSLSSISNNSIFQTSIFIFGLIACLGYILGRKTQSMSIILWIIILGIHSHNPLILNGGDTVTRLLLFRGMFLPLGHQRSLDSRGDNKKPVSVFSIASIGFVVQLCIIYVFSAYLKDHPRRISEFTATYYALSLDSFRTGIGNILYQHRGLMKFLTGFSYYLEAFGLAFLLFPRRQHRARVIAIGLFIIFHLGLGLTLKLYSFPWIMTIYWLALIPSPVRDKLTARRNQRQNNRAKDAISTTEKNSHQQGKKSDKIASSHALETNKSQSTNTMVTGPATQLTPSIIQKLPLVISIFLVVCLAYIISWNIRTTDFDKHVGWFPREVNRFGFLVRIDQYWNMFSPYPFVDDGWTVLEGTTTGGKTINALDHNKEFSLEKPSDFSDLYAHERRRKYFTNMWMKKNLRYRKYGANYFCKARDKKHPEDPLQEIKRYYVLEKTLDRYKTAPPKEVLIFENDCDKILSEKS